MKLLKTDLYLLLIDEEAEIKGNPFLCYNPLEITWGDDVVLYQGAMPEYNYRGLQKIIAYYPLNSEAKELDLPLLPNPFEEDIEKLALKKYQYKSENPPYTTITPRDKVSGFIEGYKTAQSKGQFSLEDMKKAIEMATTIRGSGSTKGFYTEEEIIQSLSNQKLPSEFIPKYDRIRLPKGDDGWEDVYQVKTITNSEGKEELVGTYEY